MDELNFVKETVKFLSDLRENNNREWFQDNKETYHNNVMASAKIFVELMGFRLKELAPNIIYAPAVNKSIFRINRDTRFSKDKTPYKTNLGLLFWEGSNPKMECSGFYFHIDPEKFFLGAGFYQFPKDTLKKYREIVNIPAKNKELSSIVSKLEKKGFSFGGKHYKKHPRGFDNNVKDKDLLLYNGFYCYFESSELEKLSEDALEYTYNKYEEMDPLHRWLVENLD